MTSELEEEYKMLLKQFKKLGGEDRYDILISKGKYDDGLFGVREKLKEIEKGLTSKEIIECAYKFNEKKN